MKRIVIVLCLMLAVCSGCGKNGKVKPITNGISFTSVIDYYNENYKCDVVIDENKVMTATMTAPEDIKGLKMTFNGDSVSAEFMGLTYEPKINSFPMGNVVQTVYDILCDISSKNENAVVDKENCKLVGKTGDREYAFTFSPSGLPLTLQIPNDNFKITFNNVTLE